MMPLSRGWQFGLTVVALVVGVVVIGWVAPFSLFRGEVIDETEESSPGSCGDGTVQAGEDCDDGNTTSCDGCSGVCGEEICGNGTIDCTAPDDPATPENETAEEECDDGNTGDGDGCNASCEMEYCGDGIIQSGMGEQCDDGNHVDCDGCNSSCQEEKCGNDVLECEEECDDKNTKARDGCDASCETEVHRCTYKCEGTVQPGGGVTEPYSWELQNCNNAWYPASSTPHCPPSLECGAPPRTATHKIPGDTTSCYGV